MTSKTYFLVAAILCALTAALHVGIVFGGADWYRFFGAGEGMALLAEQGSDYPATVTLIIASLLATATLYLLSGAGIIGNLPLQRLVLIGLALVFLARGLLGIPVVMWLDHPYANELQARMLFMLMSSMVCVVIGGFLLTGLVLAGRSGGTDVETGSSSG